MQTCDGDTLIYNTYKPNTSTFTHNLFDRESQLLYNLNEEN